MPSTEPAAAPWPEPGLHARAAHTLATWRAPSAEQAELREAYLAFVLGGPQVLWRSHAAGHLTASGIVLDADARHVLLVDHPRAGKWLPPGGHLEPEDTSLQAAALREVTEETGLAELGASAYPLVLSAHPFTCSLGVPTRHLDVAFLIRAPRTGAGTPPEPVCSPESLAVRWWPIDALPQPRPARLDPAIAAAVRAARATV